MVYQSFFDVEVHRNKKEKANKRRHISIAGMGLPSNANISCININVIGIVM